MNSRNGAGNLHNKRLPLGERLQTEQQFPARTALSPTEQVGVHSLSLRHFFFSAHHFLPAAGTGKNTFLFFSYVRERTPSRARRVIT